MMYDPNLLTAALIQAVERIEPNLFITLVFNRDVKLGPAARAVEEFCKRLERRAHGKRWLDYPAAERFKALAFPEHIESNLHFHLAGHASKRICGVALDEAEDVWRHLTKTGHADAQMVESQRAVARYITKCTRDRRALENFVAYAPKPKL